MQEEEAESQRREGTGLKSHSKQEVELELGPGPTDSKFLPWSPPAMMERGLESSSQPLEGPGERWDSLGP